MNAGEGFAVAPAEVARQRLRKETLTKVGLCAATSLLLAATFQVDQQSLVPLAYLEPIAFFALVPLLLALRNTTHRAAFGYALFAGFLYFGLRLHVVYDCVVVYGQSTPLRALALFSFLCIATSLYWGAMFAALTYCARRAGWQMGWMLAPAWMAMEFLRNRLATGFPLGNLGHTQVDNLYMAQVASVGGIYLIAFVLAQSNAALFEMVRSVRYGERPFPRAMAFATLGLVVGCHAFGAFRVHLVERALTAAPKVEIGLIQGNVDARVRHHEHYAASRYEHANEALEAEGVDLIVWPEDSFPYKQGWDVTSFANRGLRKPVYQAKLLIGVDQSKRVGQARLMRNSAFLLDGNLSVRGRYSKRHLVPFGEYVPWGLQHLGLNPLLNFTYEAGEDARLSTELAGVATNIGVLICYDAFFTEGAKEHAAGGANLLVMMTNDMWLGTGGGPMMFFRVSRQRAIESGLSVVRAAKTGLSGYFDPLGRVAQATDSGLPKLPPEMPGAMAAPVTRTHEVTVAESTSLYPKIGDSLSWAALAVSCGGFGYAAFGRRSRLAGKKAKARKTNRKRR